MPKTIKGKSAAGKVSFWKKILFLAVLAVAFLAILETTCFLFHRVSEGEWFSFTKIRNEQILAASLGNSSLVMDPDDTQFNRQSPILGSAIHPYLGFVFDSDWKQKGIGKTKRSGVNKYGFLDDDVPSPAVDDDSFTIGIVGGSVACWFAGQTEDELRRRLGKHPYLKNRKIRVVNLALGGYKQPQQLMTLTYMLALGNSFDMVLNIDGFNDIVLPVLENLQTGVYPYYPRSWHLMLESSPEIELQRAIGKATVMREARKSWALFFLERGFRYSVAMQYLWKAGDRLLNRGIKNNVETINGFKLDRLNFRARGPGFEAQAEEDVFKELAGFWADCSILMKRICDSNGILYHHFLQPNQYVKGSKPMGQEELKVAYNDKAYAKRLVEKGYPHLQAQADRLLKSGVRFRDMTMVFAEVEEPLYYDIMCHFNIKGNLILANRIADIILKKPETTMQ